MGNVELSSEEKQLAMQNMPAGSAEAEVESVVLVLGQVYSAAALTQDEDIGEDDQVATHTHVIPTSCPGSSSSRGRETRELGHEVRVISDNRRSSSHIRMVERDVS